MSFNIGYEDAPAHRRRAEGDRQTRHNQEYVEETCIQQGSGNTGGRQMSLVQRHRDDSTDSIEEIERDFPPGVGGYVRRNTTVREDARRARSAGQDRYDDYDATNRGLDYYEKKSHRRYDDRRSRCYESSSSSSPKPRGCCKSLDGQAINTLGLGGAAAAAAGHYRSRSRGCGRDRSRDDRRRGHSSSSSSSFSSESRDIGGGGSGLAEIAAGKVTYNCIRSKSRGRVRSSSSSSYHRRSPVRRERGQSFSDSLRNSDLPSSSDEERQLKKLRGKELLSGVLATATTIHAAHVVYKNRKRRHERKKALVEGEISPEEAKKERNRARLMDAAFMGIAALGIKSAVTEWKKKKERKIEIREFRERQQINHNRRLKKEQGLKNHNDSGHYGGSEPNLNSRHYSGSKHYDGNPYSAGALSPPPPGPPPARY